MWTDDAILAGVLEEFEALCRIPHPSGQEAPVAAMLSDQLSALGYHPALDAAGNLLCDIPGTEGLETMPQLALQAHMDMVCVGAPDYAPERDPIRTCLKDGFLCTDGRSSLGADCGIGLSAAMYLLKANRPHVPLRLIFTVDEERGLSGAKQLSADCLSGCSALINLDGFHFGELMISSAGGRRQTFRRTPDCFFPMLDHPVTLTVSGLLGGHSGDDIGSGRANAAQLLLWLLQSIETPYELAGIDAGTQHNAIPRCGSAHIVMDARDLDAVTALVAQFQRDAQAMYPADPDLTIALTPAEMPAAVLTVDERDDLLALGGLIPCGVSEMHPLIPEIPGVSCNLGRIYADSQQLEVQSFIRACQDDTMEVQGDFLAAAAEGFGYSAWSDTYPAWSGVAQDPLTDLFLAEGKALGLSLKKNAVHVGLETSILHHLAPELPMVSTGMDVLSPHSPSERVRLSTIVPFVRLLSAVLCHWGQNCTHIA